MNVPFKMNDNDIFDVIKLVFISENNPAALWHFFELCAQSCQPCQGVWLPEKIFSICSARGAAQQSSVTFHNQAVMQRWQTFLLQYVNVFTAHIFSLL